MKTDYDPSAPKRPVNLTLNESLMSQAKALTDNLSADEYSSLQCRSSMSTGTPGNTKTPYLSSSSAQFDGYRRRVVVPLVRATAIGKFNYAAFNPTVKFAAAQSCSILAT